MLCTAQHCNDENSFLISYSLVLICSSRQNASQWGRLKKVILYMSLEVTHRSCLLFNSNILQKSTIHISQASASLAVNLCHLN